MKATWNSVAFVSIVSGLIGFGLFFASATIFWRIHPYSDNATAEEIKLVWAIHVLSEKLFGFLVLVICAIGAAIPLRRNWRYGFVAAIGSGITFQAIIIIAYVARFGFTPYLEHNRFWSTMCTTIAISALFGFLSIWGSYRRENKH